jgi:hypothetical protein
MIPWRHAIALRVPLPEQKIGQLDLSWPIFCLAAIGENPWTADYSSAKYIIVGRLNILGGNIMIPWRHAIALPSPRLVRLGRRVLSGRAGFR